jgi:hypothetical protein
MQTTCVLASNLKLTTSFCRRCWGICRVVVIVFFFFCFYFCSSLGRLLFYFSSCNFLFYFYFYLFLFHYLTKKKKIFFCLFFFFWNHCFAVLPKLHLHISVPALDFTHLALQHTSVVCIKTDQYPKFCQTCFVSF